MVKCIWGEVLMEQEKSGNTIGLREHQLIMLGILSEFATICEEHCLTYYLDAGTLLGAVRHQGFIPWDNDMDVCMLRNDYNKLLEFARKNNGLINDHLLLLEPTESVHSFCKVCDLRTKLIEYPDSFPIDTYVYIDVFPKDGIAKRGISARAVCCTSAALQLVHWFNKFSIPYWKTGKKGIAKKAIAYFLAPIIQGKNLAIRVQDWVIKQYGDRHPIEECQFVTTLVIGEYDLITPLDAFKSTILVPFEGEYFTAPAGFDDWLIIKYGKDYMNLPPLEKRAIHNVNVSWR